MRKLVVGMIAVAGLAAATQPAMAQGVIPAIRYRAHDVVFSDFEGFSGNISYLSLEIGAKVGL
jgi:hypothetical protein